MAYKVKEKKYSLVDILGAINDNLILIFVAILFFSSIFAIHGYFFQKPIYQSTAKLIKHVNNFSYNKLIANLHEVYGFLSKEISNNYCKKTLIKNYGKILITMMPIIPHFASECLEKNNFKIDIIWPVYDETLLFDDNIKIVVQINGKKRALVDAKRNIEENDLIKNIKQNNDLKKYLNGKELSKIIFVKNKLINIIL